MDHDGLDVARFSVVLLSAILNVQLTIASFPVNLPPDNVTALDIENLSRAAQQDTDGSQFTLKNLVVDLVVLAQQASPQFCLDAAGGGEEEFYVSRFPRGFPQV